MNVKKKLKSIKQFFLFDLKWILVHLVDEVIQEIINLLTNTKHTILKQDRPKELRKLFFMMFAVFAFTDRHDIMMLGAIGFFVSHFADIYSSKKYINTMRRLTGKKIGVDYGKILKNNQKKSQDRNEQIKTAQNSV